MVISADSKFNPAILNSHSSEDDVAEFIDWVRINPIKREFLISLLAEQHPLYKGRGTNQVIRIRGYILASFEAPGFSEDVLPFILDELENSRSAYLVAAAVKALRGLKRPTVQLVPYLLKAVDNIRYIDDAITFETYKPQWPLTNYTSALKEIFITFQWLGAYANGAVRELKKLLDQEAIPFSSEISREIEKAIACIETDTREIGHSCCELPTLVEHVPAERKNNGNIFEAVSEIIIEDQQGKKQAFSAFFSEKPSVIVFFYTRCNNPNKCSLTITKLGQLQKLIKENGLENSLKTAAITYDPGYDSPSRLKQYGESRGFSFDANNRIIRVEKETLSALQTYFNLGVNFSGSIVNQHKIELYIIDKDGKIRYVFSRLQWNIDEVLSAIKHVLMPPEQKDIATSAFAVYQQKIRSIISSIWSVILPIGIAFFPKCSICWAAYLSMLGITGLHAIPYSPWLFPVLIATMGINLFVLFRGANQRNGLTPAYISLLGILLLLVAGIWAKSQVALYLGLFLIYSGSLLNSLSYRFFLKLKTYSQRRLKRFTSLIPAFTLR